MFTTIVRRAGGAVALAAAMALTTAGIASAHECYIVNRSDQGNAKAGANSQAWYTLDVAVEVQAGVDDPESEEVDGYTQLQADCIIETYEATGAPMSATFLVKGANGQNGVLASNNPNTGHATDGHGVDHFFADYGDEIFGSFAACGVGFPEPPADA